MFCFIDYYGLGRSIIEFEEQFDFVVVGYVDIGLQVLNEKVGGFVLLGDQGLCVIDGGCFDFFFVNGILC